MVLCPARSLQPFSPSIVCGMLAVVLGTCLGNFVVGQERGVEEAVFDERRMQLIERVLKPGGIRNEDVLRSVAATKRHLFIPESLHSQAYLDRALPIGEHQTISSPFIVALMTEILEVKPTDKVLEIGTGSGYQAAVLSPLVDTVYSIEILDDLQKRTADLLRKLGYTNIVLKSGDGYQGWVEHAPFDKIIVTCSPDKIPQPLVDQLSEGGLMVIPVGECYQQMLRRYRKTQGGMVADFERPTQFVPMTGVAESQRVDRPDGGHPKLLNTDFEAPVTDRYIPHWYYEFGVEAEKDETAPVGKQVVKFSSDQPGGPSMLLQGLPLDGKQIAKVKLSGHVMTRGVRLSNTFDEQPFIVLQFYDEHRNHIEYHWIGPFIGDTAWTKAARDISVPINSHEAIVMIGLFGAAGTAYFDGIELEVLERRSEIASPAKPND